MGNELRLVHSFFLFYLGGLKETGRFHNKGFLNGKRVEFRVFSAIALHGPEHWAVLAVGIVAHVSIKVPYA